MRNDPVDVAHSAPVDHAGRPPGSRVPLRTPIGERDADLRDEHAEAVRVQLRAPRSSVSIRAFALSRLDGASDLAEAARSRSHVFLLASLARSVGNERPPGAIPGAVSFSPPTHRGFACR